MNVRIVAGSLVVVGLFAGPVLPQDDKGGGAQQNLDALMKAAELGEHHKHLKMREGVWDVVVRFWMDSSQPPIESKGRAENTLIHGGRFLQEKFEGDFMGMKF